MKMCVGRGGHWQGMEAMQARRCGAGLSGPGLDEEELILIGSVKGNEGGKGDSWVRKTRNGNFEKDRDSYDATFLSSTNL